MRKLLHGSSCIPEYVQGSVYNQQVCCKNHKENILNTLQDTHPHIYICYLLLKKCKSEFFSDDQIDRISTGFGR